MTETIDKQIEPAAEKDYGINTLAELWKRGLDVESGPAERPRRPYSQVEWVFICVNKILNECSGIHLALSTANDDIVESGPVYDFLFNRPEAPIDDFLTQTIGYIALFKECYWILPEKDKIRPTGILVAGPNHVRPQIRDGVLVGYKFRPPGGKEIPLFIEDVHPLLGFNPDSPYRGVGPTAAGKLTISSSYQATLFNESSMANGARISTMLTVPQGVKLEDDEKQFLIKQFESRHKGARNAGKTFLATGGMDLKVLSQTMRELQMVDLRNFDAKTICALFDVPPEIVGLNSEAQYAHGPATQRFIAGTIAPLLSFVARHITLGILYPYRFTAGKNKMAAFSQSKTFIGSRLSLKARPFYRIDKIKAVRSGQQIFAWFAIEDHPAIQEMLRERAEKMIKYVEKGVPLNQVIDAGDLPFEHVDWGNDWWVSAGMVPAREIMEGGLDASIGEDLPEGETDEPEDGDKGITPADNPDPIIEQKKARILQKYYASFSPLEKQYIAKIRNYHRRQKTEMIARLEEALGDSKSIQNSELKIKNSTDIVAKVVFDLTTENGKLRAFHKVFYTEGIELGAAQTISEVAGTAGSDLAAAAKQASRSAAAKQSIVRSIKKVQKINQTTKNRISKTLFDGLEKGEGLNDLARRISKDASFSMARAKRIARTSTSSAVSSGRFEGLKTVGAELKRWLSARNEAVRKTHRNADSQYTQTPIPVGQKFTVGSALLMYPGDPSGPAEEVANCRCMILAAKAKGKAITLDHYDRRVKFVEYAELKTLLSED